MKHHWSIRAHLFVLVLAVALPFVSLLAYSLVVEGQREAQAAQAATLTLAQVTRANTQRFLTDAETLLVGLVERPLIRAIDSTRCDPLLAEFHDLHPEFSNIVVINLSGQVVCSVIPRSSEVISVAEMEWFQRVIKTDRFVVAKPFTGRFSSNLISALAYPIHDDTGKLIGVLCMGIDLVRFQRILNATPLPTGAIVTMIDDEGTIIARSLEPEKMVGQSLRGKKVVDLMLVQEEGHIQAPGSDGVDRIWGFTSVPAAGWHVSVGIPTEIVFAPVRTAALRDGVLVVAVILLVGALAVYLSHRIERPIRHLAQAIEATGEGQLNTRLSIEGPAEIVEVAQQFNAMLIARKQAEESLRIKDMAIASAVTAIVFTDLQNRVIYANPAFLGMWGYEHEAEVLGRLNTDLVPVAERVPEIVAEISRHGSWAGEIEALKKDGTIFFAQITTTLVKDETDTPLLTMGTCVDITTRKQAEAALRQSEERFRQVIASISDHIYMAEVPSEGSYILHYLSPNVEALTGYPTEKFLTDLGFWASTVNHPEDKAIIEAQAVQVRAGHSNETEYRLIRADGRVIWVRNSIKVEPTGTGSMMVYGVISDISQAKDLEEQFRQSQKMDAVGQLAGGIAHDFNNLLTVIGGYSELALTRHMRDGQHPLRPNIEQIKKASDRASLLTGQLLAFSRKQMLQPKVLDLNSVVTDIEKMLGRLIGENIEVATLLQPELGLVKVDPGQIEQVIINLAVNARDAMPQGGKLIIETDNVELDETYASQHVGVKPGAYVLLSLSDTGHGMDTETRSHMFEPFFTTKERGRGTGLGLATVHGIVIQSGGHIWVYSEPGHGTTFKIYLPRLAEAVEPAKQDELPIIFERGSETIVLVEDEDMVRELARRILSVEGYTVLEAHNGQEALQICQEHSGQIDLVITDVIMPGMSGRQLADRLVSLYPTLRVLYISGYTDNALAQQGVLDPDITLLEKPFTAQELARKVREFLNTEIRD